MKAISTAKLYNLTDEDLMERFQDGTVQAFNILVSRYKDRLHNFLYRYTHNHEDCEDLVQETFLRVHRSRHSYERIAKFSTWMYTIALNLAKSLYKKSQRMQRVSIHEDPDDSESREMVFEDSHILQDEKLHQKLCVRELERGLQELSEEFREAIVLRDIQELTYEEIAEITDTAMGTVKSRINRGRIQLQEILNGYVQPETN
ncbi:MAG: sigma-70 family RNA polymerase sigma factor [Balneolaceae bacterium]